MTNTCMVSEIWLSDAFKNSKTTGAPACSRQVATRYKRLAVTYLAMLSLISAVIWLN